MTQRPHVSTHQAQSEQQAAPERSVDAPRQTAPHVLRDGSLREARRAAAAAFEREYVTLLLTNSGGNITRAAAMAGVSRQMIQKLARKYGL
jgi:transcriptional regulator with GAF, ATPase, and Fis domain